MVPLGGAGHEPMCACSAASLVIAARFVVDDRSVNAYAAILHETMVDRFMPVTSQRGEGANADPSGIMVLTATTCNVVVVHASTSVEEMVERTVSAYAVGVHVVAPGAVIDAASIDAANMVAVITHLVHDAFFTRELITAVTGAPDLADVPEDTSCISVSAVAAYVKVSGAGLSEHPLPVGTTVPMFIMEVRVISAYVVRDVVSKVHAVGIDDVNTKMTNRAPS